MSNKLLDAVVDLSHWNQVDSFHAVKDAGVQGVILKATQGTSYIDPTFRDYARRAAKVGLLVGAYHFGYSGDPERQAEHFVKTAKPVAPLLVLDWEDSELTQAEAEAFCRKVKQLDGRYPVLYSGEAFLKAHGGDNLILKNCPLWIAKYGKNDGRRHTPPRTPSGWPAWRMWQYTSQGRVPGIKGPIDRNVFSGTAAELRALWL